MAEGERKKEGERARQQQLHVGVCVCEGSQDLYLSR